MSPNLVQQIRYCYYSCLFFKRITHIIFIHCGGRYAVRCLRVVDGWSGIRQTGENLLANKNVERNNNCQAMRSEKAPSSPLENHLFHSSCLRSSLILSCAANPSSHCHPTVFMQLCLNCRFFLPCFSFFFLLFALLFQALCTACHEHTLQKTPHFFIVDHMDSVDCFAR